MKLRRLLGIVIALVMLLTTAVPAMAADVTTTVTINGGTSAPPLVKAKWEQDLTPSLEDGDPLHAKYVPNSPTNSQFLPPLVKGGKKLVQYWAIVTDADGVNTISQVTVDVFHPAGPPRNGSFKYQLILQPVALETCLPAYTAARSAKLVTYQQNTTPPINDADVLFELDKRTAACWMIQGELDYEQPAGDYKTVIDAFDNSNTWASQGTPKTNLENLFTYVGVAGIELDFNSFNYGSVTVSSEKWIAGDTIWNTPLAAAPAPNPATVRSIGNTLVKITLKNTDMGFGFNGVTPTTYSGSAPPPTGQSNWNVVFDARMGSNPANAMYYDPNITITLPNVLQLSSQDELDFSIHVLKAAAGSKSGTITIGAVIAPF